MSHPSPLSPRLTHSPLDRTMPWTLFVYTLAIWLVGLGGVLAPLCMASYNKVVLTLCNSLAAGVMLSAGFVHLLHDAVSSLAGLQTKMNGYPVSEFVCALSFICVFYIETLVSPPVKPGEHHHLDHIQVDKGTECFPSQWEWQAGQSPNRTTWTRPKQTEQQQREKQQQDSSPLLPLYGAVLPPSTATGGLSGPNCCSHSSSCSKQMKETPSSPQMRAGPATRLLEDTGNQAGAGGGGAAVQGHTGLLAHMQLTHSHQVDLEGSLTARGDHQDQEVCTRAASSTKAGHPSSSSAAQMHSQTHSYGHGHGHSHEQGHNHSHTHGDGDMLGLSLHGHKDLHTFAGALCLLAALGFHSVIEGLGLATATTQNDATQVGVFIAILAHKGLAGECVERIVRHPPHIPLSFSPLLFSPLLFSPLLFLSLLSGPDPPRRLLLILPLPFPSLVAAYPPISPGLTLGTTMLLAEASQTEFLGTALLFSVATPLGVGLGALISSYCKSAEALGLMAAIAAGTFIHVAAIEIIPSAFRDTSATHLAKLASLTVGFLAMSALFLVE